MKFARRIAALISGAAAALPVAGCSGASDKAGDSTAAQTGAAVEPPAAPAAYASLTGDAAKGETLYFQCKACHALEPGKNGLGPSLHAIVGHQAGKAPAYTYSPANKNSGVIWSEEKLFEYLEAPQKVMPGTKMSYAGMKQAQQRADLIAYLKTKR